MLQNAYLLAKIGVDTAENEQHFAKIVPKPPLGWRSLGPGCTPSAGLCIPTAPICKGGPACKPGPPSGLFAYLGKLPNDIKWHCCENLRKFSRRSQGRLLKYDFKFHQDRRKRLQPGFLIPRPPDTPPLGTREPGLKDSNLAKLDLQNGFWIFRFH